MRSLRWSSLEVENVEPIASPFLFHLPASRIFPCVKGLIANESDSRGLEQGGNTRNPKVDYEICFSLDWPGGSCNFVCFSQVHVSHIFSFLADVSLIIEVT